ncbi:hypothetical protein GYMLUDRAFT_491805 [Collybiopsis luxurians FD-317 M1]|uniref:Uncharacterized protein n=1 Tax=Collybiopsis luxurians FD-317 M1 TaxID=944289 RepID=A0A0D0C3T9_9AGAR|nr:hypothetical protein GYMLUDRAFT_491805 [Collybiopsis luxurians FD-317 M1]
MTPLNCMVSSSNEHESKVEDSELESPKYQNNEGNPFENDLILETPISHSAYSENSDLEQSANPHSEDSNSAGLGVREQSSIPQEPRESIQNENPFSLSPTNHEDNIYGGIFNTAEKDFHTHTTHNNCTHSMYNNCAFPDRDSIPNNASTAAAPEPTTASTRKPCTGHRRRRRWSITRFVNIVYHHYLPPLLYPFSQWIPSHWMPPFAPWYNGYTGFR